MTTLNTLLLLRRGTSAEFAGKILKQGEPSFATDTKVFKIGDGSTAWENLGFANQSQIEALIKVVDDKVAALDDAYATDEEVRVIKEALEASIKTINDELATYGDIVTHNAAEFEAAGAAAEVAGDLADYEAANDARVKAIEDEIDTFGDIVTRNAEEFATAAQGLKADAAAVKAEVDEALAARYTKTEADNLLAGKADKSVVDAMYTNAQIDGFIADAKKYADDNDADTKYGITYDSDAKKIKLVEGGSEIEIDASAFIKDGMISNVTIGEDNDLIITFNTDAGKENIVLPLDQLVDIYTGSEGARVKVTVASDKSISADLVAGSISKNYLDADVQASLGKADTALQAADLNGYALETYVDQAEADAVAEAARDAASKYETIGTAQGIVDGLKLGETYEPIGAETRAKSYTDTEIADFNTETVAPIAARVKAIEDAPYATRATVATAKQEAIDAAKSYADGLDHEDTTYAVAATENALEFTVTPTGKGSAQTIKLVAPVVDTGVMSVTAGTDIVVTPGEDGAVEVAHKAYTTGTVKDAAHDSATDPSFITGISIENGHVTGATVRNLAEVLEAMSFIFDGGTATDIVNE